MSNGSKFLTLNPGTLPDATALSYAFRAGTIYGGITVVDVTASTGAVGTLNLILQNYGASGTVAGGTIAAMASGTATVWAVDTPQTLTITAANAFVDAGEYVYLKKIESAAGNDLSEDAGICISYVDGVVTQG